MKFFEELYSNYHKDVFRFLNKLCGYDSNLAEELTQETFYHAYLGITKFKAECSVKTWLIQIAKNRYFLFLRKKSRAKNISYEENLIDLIDEYVLDSVDKMFETQLLSDSLDIVLSFPENMKIVFINRIFDNMPYKEISQQLSISENSAKVLFHRAKLQLRKRLKGDYNYEIWLYLNPRYYAAL